MGLDQFLMRKKDGAEDKTAIYWRKTNFVHRFFTEDWMIRGFDDDNCTPFPTSEEELRELSMYCKEVLEDHEEAPYLLPTQSGFFFGDTEYGEWYFEDVKYTKDKIDELLETAPLEEGEEFYYTAWY